MLKFNVPDMSCNHCVASITQAVHSAAPDAAVQADLDARQVSVIGNVDENTIVAALSDIGFTAQPVQAS